MNVKTKKISYQNAIKFLSILFLMLMLGAHTCIANIWELPDDFNVNYNKYPSAESLPDITVPGPIENAGRIVVSGEYYLTHDIYARADGFIINADNVTIDLRGYSIIYACENYNRAYGIGIPAHYIHSIYFPRETEAPDGGVKNFVITDSVGGGQIIKGPGLGLHCSAIFAHKPYGLTITNVTINHSGIDASGIETLYQEGALTIRNCNIIYDYVRDGIPVIEPAKLAYPPDNVDTFYWVSNRHSGFVGGININHSLLTNCIIQNNTISGSPQWGIFIGDDTMLPNLGHKDNAFFDDPEHYPYVYEIAFNHINLNTVTTNGYGIGSWPKKANIHDNVITGYGAGTVIGGEYMFFHDNTINVSQGSNFEYKSRLWAHGIKLEGTAVTSDRLLPDQCLIKNNKVTVTTRGETDYINQDFWFIPGSPNRYFGNNGEARVLDFGVAIGTWNEIRNNEFIAFRKKNDNQKAVAIEYTQVKYFAGKQETSALMEENKFISNDVMIDLSHFGDDLFNTSSLININNQFINSSEESSQVKFVAFGGNQDLGSTEVRNPQFLPSENDFMYSAWYGVKKANFKILKDTKFCANVETSLKIVNITDGSIIVDRVISGEITQPLTTRELSVLDGHIEDITPEYALYFGSHLTNNWIPGGEVGSCSNSGDSQPPADVTNVKFNRNGDGVTFTWSNPPDSDYAGVKIVYTDDGTEPALDAAGNIVTGQLFSNAAAPSTSVSAVLPTDKNYNFSFFTYDNSGNYSHTFKITIPAVHVTYQPNPVNNPKTEVTFSVVIDPECLGTVTYEWDFDDGGDAQTVTTGSIGHAFDTSRTYNVVVTLRNESGCTIIQTIAVQVNDLLPSKPSNPQ